MSFCIHRTHDSSTIRALEDVVRDVLQSQPGLPYGWCKEPVQRLAHCSFDYQVNLFDFHEDAVSDRDEWSAGLQQLVADELGLQVIVVWHDLCA